MLHLLQLITVELQRVSCAVGSSMRHGMQHEKAARRYKHCFDRKEIMTCGLMSMVFQYLTKSL
jgi:hypothetical protein